MARDCCWFLVQDRRGVRGRQACASELNVEGRWWTVFITFPPGASRYLRTRTCCFRLHRRTRTPMYVRRTLRFPIARPRSRTTRNTRRRGATCLSNSRRRKGARVEGFRERTSSTNDPSRARGLRGGWRWSDRARSSRKPNRGNLGLCYTAHTALLHIIAKWFWRISIALQPRKRIITKKISTYLRGWTFDTARCLLLWNSVTRDVRRPPTAVNR